MDSRRIAQILEKLDSAERAAAWSEFLVVCSPLILQVAYFLEEDEDTRADCFLYICEQLSRNRFRRLRRFSVDGPASFPTWLRATARNLWVDWRRQKFGRPRMFRSVQDLPLLDQEVYRCVFERGMSTGGTLAELSPRFPKLTEHRIHESVAQLGERLTPRQRWILRARAAKEESLSKGLPHGDPPSVERQIADPRPDPETLANLEERRTALAHAMSCLSKAERLLLRLRFEQGLTLEQVARVAGLENAQKADRRIKELLGRLRQELEGD